MNERFTLNALMPDSVTLIKQNYAVVEGVEYPVGLPLWKAYINSIEGRAEVKAEISEPYKTAIFAVWGDSPTLADPNVD